MGENKDFIDVKYRNGFYSIRIRPHDQKCTLTINSGKSKIAVSYRDRTDIYFKENANLHGGLLGVTISHIKREFPEDFGLVEAINEELKRKKPNQKL